MKLFLYLHIVGLVLIGAGLYLLFLSPGTPQTVEGMVWISANLGVGLTLISPYPVVKVIQWMGGPTR